MGKEAYVRKYGYGNTVPSIITEIRKEECKWKYMYIRSQI